MTTTLLQALAAANDTREEPRSERLDEEARRLAAEHYDYAANIAARRARGMYREECVSEALEALAESALRYSRAPLPFRRHRARSSEDCCSAPPTSPE